MSPPIRLTYLITASEVGGAERQVRDLAIAMAERGDAVTVVSMLPLGEEFADLPERGIGVASLGMTQGVADPRALLRLARLLRSSRPDVLHAHMVHANLLARVVRVLAPVPVVISTMHNQNQGARWRYLAYRVTDRLGDLTTAVSQAALDEARRLGAAGPRPMMVVPNGLELAPHRPDPAIRAEARRTAAVGDDFLWLAVGRLTEAKDYPNLMASFERVLQVEPRTRLLVAGPGPLERQLRSAVRDRGLEERMAFLGQRNDVPCLMQAADGYVMSSAWEGLPMVLLEAAATGLPIVTTDVGGAQDVVVDGETGFIVPRADDAALAGAMLRVMTLSEEARATLGRAALAHVARFDMSIVAETWDGLYRDLLSRKKRHVPDASTGRDGSG